MIKKIASILFLFSMFSVVACAGVQEGKGSDQETLTPDWAIITWDTEIQDSNGEFSVSSFTASGDQKVNVSATVRNYNNCLYGVYDMGIRINGVDIGVDESSNEISSVEWWVTVSTSSMNLNSGDIVSIWIRNGLQGWGTGCSTAMVVGDGSNTLLINKAGVIVIRGLQIQEIKFE